MRYLICNGKVIDGTGRYAYKADVLIEGEHIQKIAANIKCSNAMLIDASDCVVTPAFIDIHRHCDIAPFTDPSFGGIELRQGIATVVVGNCGLSPVPVSPIYASSLYEYLQPIIGKMRSDMNWISYKDYSNALSSVSLPVNMGFLAGTDSIKIALKGFSDKPYSYTELDMASGFMSDAIDAGALGASSGIMYTPDCFSTADELSKIVRPISRIDGILSTHIRGEGNSLVSSVDEVIEIASKAEVRLNISHFKATGQKNWHNLIYKAIEHIENARNEGLDVNVDFYPYDGGSSLLQSLIPPSFMGSDPLRVADLFLSKNGKQLFSKAISAEYQDWDNMVKSIGWNRIIICSVSSPEDKYMEGKDIMTLSSELGYDDPAFFVADLYVKEMGKVGIIALSMNIEDVYTVAKLPYSVLISDALYGGGTPHPRLLGAFPRFLRIFSRQDNIVSYEDAICKMTGLPAKRIGLKHRGVIAEGNIADVLVFKPDKFRDNAEYTGKKDMATGLSHMFIAGHHVIENDKILCRQAGTFINGYNKWRN